MNIDNYINDIKKIVQESNEALEGNLFYTNCSNFKTHEHLKLKQETILKISKFAQNKICEIGFNAGHSSLLFLLGIGSKDIEFTIFDINNHKYTIPCFEFLKSKFLNVKFKFIEGNSIITIPKFILNLSELNSYDIVHVDGGHSIECITNDMKNADLLCKKNGYIIIDDTNMSHINNIVDLYISQNKYKEINFHNEKNLIYSSRVIQKI
jgi:hypothetical protein